MDEQFLIILRPLAVIACVVAFITLQRRNLEANASTIHSINPSLRPEISIPTNYLTHFIDMIASRSKDQTDLNATVAFVAIASEG